MDNNDPTICICCYTTLWNINSAKHAINDKLQGSVATYLRRGQVVNNQIKKGFESVSEENFKISEYFAKLQARTWLFRALCTLANTLLKDGVSARDNHVHACNKYTPI